MSTSYSLQATLDREDARLDHVALGFLALETALGAGLCLLATSLGTYEARARRLTQVVLGFVLVVGTVVEALGVLLAVSLAEPDPWTVPGGGLVWSAFAHSIVTASMIPVALSAQHARLAPEPARVAASARSLVHTGVWLLALAALAAIAPVPWSLRVPSAVAAALGVAAIVRAQMAERALATALDRVARGEVPGWSLDAPDAAAEAAAKGVAVPDLFDRERSERANAEQDVVLAQVTDASEVPAGGAFRTALASTAVAAVPPQRPTAGARLRGHLRGVAVPAIVLGGIASFLTIVFVRADEPMPRRLADEFRHYPVSRFDGYRIPGLDLYAVQQGGRLVVGWDPRAERVVEGEELFHLCRGLTPDELALRANDMLFHGACVIDRSDPPRVVAGRLRFTCGAEKSPQDLAVTPEMLAPGVGSR